MTRPLLFVAGLLVQIGHLKPRRTPVFVEIAYPLVRMCFVGVIGSLRAVVTILPRTIGQVQLPDERDDFVTEIGPLSLIGSIPENQAGMVPVISHKFSVFVQHLVFVPYLVTEGFAIVPDGVFVLEQ